MKNEGNEYHESLSCHCIYCGSNSINGTLWLWPVYTAGTYYQHWDHEKGIGCPENKENIAPNGEKVNRK